jgi:hypothetical protein
VLAEMVRVTRPAGQVVVTDADHEATIIHTPDPAASRQIPRLAGKQVRHGRIGRQLRGLLLDAGLVNVTVELSSVCLTDYEVAMEILAVHPALDHAREQGIVAPEEAIAWISQLEALGRAGRFFCAYIDFLAAGTKP